MPVEEHDLAFADFGMGPERPYTAPRTSTDNTNDNAPGASDRGRSEFLERETGFEPATLSLGRDDEPLQDQ